VPAGAETTRESSAAGKATGTGAGAATPRPQAVSRNLTGRALCRMGISIPFANNRC